MARWQGTKLKACLEDLKGDQVISLIDFAKNYLFKGKNEIQRQHRYNFQIMILIHIMYILNLEYDGWTRVCKHLKIHYFYYKSETMGNMIHYSCNIV